MLDPLAILRASLLAATALVAAACNNPSGGESCFAQTACKYVDLLAACDVASGCLQAGDVQLSGGAASQAPTAVQTALGSNTRASLGQNSSVTVPVSSDAATRAALPLLEIEVELDPSQLDQVSVVIVGQPGAACAPTVTPHGGVWQCSLPAGAQSVELRTGTSLLVIAMKLTEPTCTGTTQICAL